MFSDTFVVFWGLGLEHIIDAKGYDHMLFLAALVASYSLRSWRPVLALVTAFTLGHSVSLALATLGHVRASTDWVEFLIPVTIVLTCLVGEWQAQHPRKRPWLAYGLTVGFGLIHGLGFSGYLRSLLGRQADLFQPLLAFNLGLEVGQLMVVVVLLGLGVAGLWVERQLRHPGLWRRSVWIAAGLAALRLAVERWPS